MFAWTKANEGGGVCTFFFKSVKQVSPGLLKNDLFSGDGRSVQVELARQEIWRLYKIENCTNNESAQIQKPLHRRTQMYIGQEIWVGNSQRGLS